MVGGKEGEGEREGRESGVVMVGERRERGREREREKEEGMGG